MCASETKRVDMAEKHNTLIAVNCGTYFSILGFYIQSLQCFFDYA